MTLSRERPRPPAHNGHRQRMRERFLSGGLSGMLDYEKLEFLLSFGIPRRDVKPLARLLLERFESISGVLDASHEELRETPGVGEHVATLLKLTRELITFYLEEELQQKPEIREPDAVLAFARSKLGGRQREALMSIMLNAAGKVVHFDITEGTLDRATVYPRNVLEAALKHHASAVILVHNHPSENCEPSHGDLELTRKLTGCLGAAQIRLLDHFIVSRTNAISLAEMGYV